METLDSGTSRSALFPESSLDTWGGTAIRASAEARFQGLIEQIPAVVYTERLGDTGAFTYVSPQVEAVLGFTPEEIVSTPGFSVERIHPDDRERVEIEGERTTATGEPFRLEYRLQARDGRWVHVRDEAVLIRDANGIPLHWQGVLIDVTELRQSEERFRALVQNGYDVITVVDPDGVRRYASPSIETTLGYAPAELIDGSALDLVHPEDAPRLRDAIDSLRQGGWRTPAFELRFRRRDGEWRDFETVGTNMLDVPGVTGIVFNSREITARKAAQEALRQSEARFRSAFDHAPIGLALVSPDGRFQQVNRSLCDLVGYTEHELLDTTFQEITHPADLADDLAQATRLWAGEIDLYELEKRYLHKDGHTVWIQLTVSGVHDDEGSRYAIAQIEDISARRHLDLERATMLASEREYTRQLRDLATMRADLTAMVAHELRSPIAALRMMTSMAATGELAPAAAAENFAAIHAQIDRLDRLVSDVAVSGEAEGDTFSMQFHPVSLAVLLDGASALARTALAGHEFSLAATPDARVWCDPERISQVLGNLIDNAAKHTPPGTPVALRAVRRRNRVRIEVANEGPGIGPEDLALIFEKFGRGQEAARRKTAGAGLGLYVSRQIVQAHGAELSVESAPDRGVVFGFELKVAV